MVSNEQPTRSATTADATPTANGAATRPQPARQRPPTAQKPGGAGPRPAPASQQPLRRRERRPEMIQKRREERHKQYERQRRQWLYTKIGIGAAVALIVLAIGAVGWTYIQDRIDESALDDVQEFAYAGNEHQDDVDITYAENPPVGGPHDSTWQQCGYYEQPIPEENAVHSMEHGAVWITYRPDLPADQIAKIKEEADNTSYILASPRPDLPVPVVLSSWNRQIQLDSVDDRAFDAFIRQYRNNPNTTPEYGGTCLGGNTMTVPD